MTARDLALRAVLHFAGFIAALTSLVLIALRDLATELVDEVRASRTETNRRGNMQPKNIKLWDSTSKLKAANARLAAVVGSNTTQAACEFSDARQLAAEVAMPVRRAS